jgi:hypothetical protein
MQLVFEAILELIYLEWMLKYKRSHEVAPAKTNLVRSARISLNSSIDGRSKSLGYNIGL